MLAQDSLHILSGQDGRTLSTGGQIYWNLSPAALYEAAIRRGEGELASTGPFVAVTAPHTGRSPKDRFIVREPSSETAIDWGAINQPIDRKQAGQIRADILAYLGKRDLFVTDAAVSADPDHRIHVRVVSESAWHTLFARNMFIPTEGAARAGREPEWTILHSPHLALDPDRHQLPNPNVVILDFEKQAILIAGTKYAGEIKKSMFAVMNYLLPRKDVLSMHCSANVGEAGDVALFFGLSGTGKTTLSTDPGRYLIGDDEHGWDRKGVFNLEGGCYAKTIQLSREGEPEIYAATQRFGTIIENVILDPQTREPLFSDDQITENTRSAYPVEFIPHHVPAGRGGHPHHIFFLTADAFGVLPPIARLTPEQIQYYFLSGYTAKVAGTEQGVTDPQATFSACFGAPFLPLPAARYADLLARYVTEHGTRVWLINTGWSGGPFGVGQRFQLAHTRAIVRAALSDRLDEVETETHPQFGLHVPVAVPGVPNEILRPRDTWEDGAAYDEKASALAAKFRANFATYEAHVPEAVRAAGPLG